MVNQTQSRRSISTGRTTARPYDVKHDALAECELDPELGEVDPMTRDGWYVEDGDVEHGLKFKAHLEPNWPAICQVSGAHMSELRLSIQLRKDSARFFEVLGHWPADEHPDEWECSLPPVLGSNFQIVIDVTLPRRLSVLPNRPYRSGSAIATRVFPFSSRGYLMDIRFADFIEHNWEADALWHIEIESTNDRPKEAVTVHLNQLIKKYYDTGSRIADPAKRTFNEIVTAGIYADLAAEVLRRGDPETDDNRNGLFRTVLGRLTNSSDRSESWWIERAKNDPHEFTRNVQHHLGLASKL